MVSFLPDIVNGPTVLVQRSPAASAGTASSSTLTPSMVIVVLLAPASSLPLLHTVYVIMYVCSDTLTQSSEFSVISISGIGVRSPTVVVPLIIATGISFNAGLRSVTLVKFRLLEPFAVALNVIVQITPVPFGATCPPEMASAAPVTVPLLLSIVGDIGKVGYPLLGKYGPETTLTTCNTFGLNLKSI